MNDLTFLLYKPSQEKEKLVEFIIGELKVELTEGPQNLLENTEQVKNFLGNLINKISTTLYDLIKIEARRIGTFTHEIRYNSKAYKIFTEKEFDFKNEKLMQREVLLFLLKKFPKDELKKFIDSFEPLPFEQYHTNHYIESILNIHKDGSVKDEMLSIYQDERPSKNRLNDILAIGSDINFEYFGENGEDEFEE